MKHFDVQITGEVQGVGLRMLTRQAAMRLGIKGFVRNEPDGSVYAEIEGEDAELDEFIKDLKEGFGRIESINLSINQSDPKDYSRFEIRSV